MVGASDRHAEGARGRDHSVFALVPRGTLEGIAGGRGRGTCDRHDRCTWLPRSRPEEGKKAFLCHLGPQWRWQTRWNFLSEALNFELPWREQRGPVLCENKTPIPRPPRRCSCTGGLLS